MEYRILGRTGLKVGAIALGCEGFADKTAEEVRADFDFAIRNGINFLDLYASNPELRSNIGAALAGRREKFVIQGHLCSVWEEGQYLRTRDPEKSLAAFEDLLARLGTDYVEIGMIHYVDAEADLREVLDGPIMRLAQRLRSEGRIRHIGLSSHNPVVAHMAARTGLIDVLMFSVNPCYDLLPPSDDVDTLWADELRAGAAQHRPRTATALRILRTRRDRHRRDEGLRRRRPAERRQLALRTPDDPGTMPRIRPDAPRRSGRNGRLPQPRRDRSGTGLVFGHGRGTRLHGGAGRAGQVLVGRALHVLRALRPVFGGDRHRRCEQILQPDPGTARDTGDGARTLQAPAAPRLRCIACGRCERNCPFGVDIIGHMRLAAAKFGY